MKYKKYPRTFHLPFSKGSTSDDKFLKDYSNFENKDIIVTLKMDGENTTMYNDHIHARSLDSGYHESRDWIKQFHSSFKRDIPKNIRICGENLYATHSLEYNNLLSYFYGFSIFENDKCLSWNDTLEWFELFGIIPVEVIYEGVFDLNKLEQLSILLDSNKHEGFVVRLKDSFDYKDFNKSVAKYVRANHVTTNSHWMYQEIKVNKLGKI